MKKYKFALGGVQRVRRIAEEQARMAVLEAQHDADAAATELQQRLADIGAARPVPGPRSSTEFQAERAHLDRHRVAILAARAAEVNALEALENARSDWVEAARRVRALDRLDERKRAEWTLETTRAAQLVTDEIASIGYKFDQEKRADLERKIEEHRRQREERG